MSNYNLHFSSAPSPERNLVRELGPLTLFSIFSEKQIKGGDEYCNWCDGNLPTLSGKVKMFRISENLKLFTAERKAGGQLLN